MGRLDGSRCLIVGGTGGIGLASARRFRDEGARVVACGRSPETCAAAAADLGPGVAVLTADAAVPEDVDRLFAEAVEILGGRLDVLFHVAGLSGRRFGDGPLHECSVAGWDAVLDANARSTFLTDRAAVRQMLMQEPDARGLRGTVLNMGSVLGWSPAPDFFGTIAYAASKGAVEAMTIAAASRYARDRIRFNLIAPALIETPMAARACGDPAILAYLAAKQPMAGGPGSAEDCAEAALFLCEPASRFTTGVVLNVDGGWCVSEGRLPDAPPPPTFEKP
ncbi:SDR family NAD(P)-dependent oxidoreductase [Paludisphaera mucosa]|uniref:SDR family NAD(P)-dependent oxidoreductase n=1 Tax=Paludisphaera mucosa TaxID=3030827 RepID=A0ABT6FEW0_9BACT|nr:SDR family oxidoreductase [Paludisphaera mucosa]MDG3006111.1 SDR family NAD(P)-dependent oxidoreductase [Paludisphaera mucosa]